MKNIYDKEIGDEVVERINKLNSTTKAKWGTMNVGQMLAHCNVTYEMVFEDIHPKPNFILKFILKAFVKKVVVSDKTYSKNGKTAPQFVMKESKDFEKEKSRLIAYIGKVQKLGASHFEGKESHSFGHLSSKEWNNMFYKHLNHHLSQFGV